MKIETEIKLSIANGYVKEVVQNIEKEYSCKKMSLFIKLHINFFMRTILSKLLFLG